MVYIERSDSGCSWGRNAYLERRPLWLRTTFHEEALGGVYALLEQENSSFRHGGYVRQDPVVLGRVEHAALSATTSTRLQGVHVLTVRTAPERTVSRSSECGAHSKHARVAGSLVAGGAGGPHGSPVEESVRCRTATMRMLRTARTQCVDLTRRATTGQGSYMVVATCHASG